MEEQSNPDLEKMCRLCLCILSEEELVGIFTPTGSVAGPAMQMSIPMRIMACAALEVQAGDGLPKAICLECRYQLEKSYYFRKRSQLSDNKLRKHIRLINLGKKSRVFQKSDDDDEMEEELEFEDSIKFIQQREEEKQEAAMELCEQRLENDFEEKMRQAKSEWIAQYKVELKDEVTKELRSTVVAKVKEELRTEMEEEIRKALRAECTDQAKAELRTEVVEECREKERVALLDELQVFLNQKKVDRKSNTNTLARTALEPLTKKKNDVPEKSVVPASDAATTITLKPEMLANDEMCTASQAEGDAEDAAEDEFYLIEPMTNQEEEEETAVTSKTPSKRPRVERSQRFEYFEDRMGAANFRLTASESSSQELVEGSYHIADTGEMQYYNKITSQSNYEDENDDENEDDDVIVFNLENDLEDEHDDLEEVKKSYIAKSSSKSQQNSNEHSKSADKLLFIQNVPVEETVESDNDNLLPVPTRKTNTPKTFKCDDCPMVFSTINSMTRHKRTHDKLEQQGASPHQCKICHVYLSCKSALKRHMIIHTGEKPYSCDHCGKSFVQREVLKRHMLTHTGAKPHKCTQCGKTFTHKYSLVNHVQRTHSEGIVEQQHACHLCPKRFNHMSGLSRHLVTHTGLTYQCVECNRKFSDRSSVRRHVATVHGAGKKSNAAADIELYTVDDAHVIVANEEDSTEYLV